MFTDFSFLLVLVCVDVTGGYFTKYLTLIFCKGFFCRKIAKKEEFFFKLFKFSQFFTDFLSMGVIF